VILGIGVNVTPESVPPDSEVIYPATSVESTLGREVDRVDLLRAILEAVIFWRGQIEVPSFWNAWEQRMAFKGEMVRVYTGTDTAAEPEAEGELLGLDEAGCLRLRTRSGEERALCTGEVRLRPLV
jgi:biotin-(acetyl-CoA carboxylase) ligase